LKSTETHGAEQIENAPSRFQQFRLVEEH